MINDLPRDSHPCPQIAPRQAHRPIATEHNALRSEVLQHVIGVRTQSLEVPIPVVSLRHHAGEFTVDVLVQGNLAHQILPRLHLVVLDFWLRDVVDDGAQIGNFFEDFQNVREVLSEDQEVEGDT